jgi:polyhydroxyalkanoate synthesis regulator phasin
MAPELGGSQISQLLESVPGIANVLRSPVADALVNMIRAGAGVGEFHLSDAAELVQYSVRRGLISADEGDRIMAEVAEAERRKRVRKRGRQRAKTAAGSKKRSTSPPKKTAKKPSRSKAAATKRTRAKSAKKARPSPRRKPTKRR